MKIFGIFNIFLSNIGADGVKEKKMFMEIECERCLTGMAIKSDNAVEIMHRTRSIFHSLKTKWIFIVGSNLKKKRKKRSQWTKNRSCTIIRVGNFQSAYEMSRFPWAWLYFWSTDRLDQISFYVSFIISSRFS